MSNFYRDEDKIEYVREIKNDRKKSKYLFFGGLSGLGILGLEYLTGVTPDIFNTPIKEMNFYQDLHLALFTLSLLTTASGAAIYGITHLMSPGIKKKVKNIDDKFNEQR